MYCQYNESRMGSVFSEMILLSIALVAFHVHLSKVSTRDWEDVVAHGRFKAFSTHM